MYCGVSTQLTWKAGSCRAWSHALPTELSKDDESFYQLRLKLDWMKIKFPKRDKPSLQGTGKILTERGRMESSAKVTKGENLITPCSFPRLAQETMHSEEGKAQSRPTLTAEAKLTSTARIEKRNGAGSRRVDEPEAAEPHPTRARCDRSRGTSHGLLFSLQGPMMVNKGTQQTLGDLIPKKGRREITSGASANPRYSGA
ncbi:hypothetical protein BC826DRAFT_1136404 [Russula brevipes]|nr:hypothetical protein BC826DRAFT_1136404 [Russula brevipes]